MIGIGEWVRLKDGRIRIFKEYINEIDVVLSRPYNTAKTIDIVKHSKNIIDLIEVGDYVNGSEVIIVYGYDEDGNDKDGLGICKVDDDYAYYTYLEDINIKSIVTKEQFNSAKYVIPEEK